MADPISFAAIVAACNLGAGGLVQGVPWVHDEITRNRLDRLQKLLLKVQNREHTCADLDEANALQRKLHTDALMMDNEKILDHLRETAKIMQDKEVKRTARANDPVEGLCSVQTTASQKFSMKMAKMELIDVHVVERRPSHCGSFQSLSTAITDDVQSSVTKSSEQQKRHPKLKKAAYWSLVLTTGVPLLSSHVRRNLIS